MLLPKSRFLTFISIITLVIGFSLVTFTVIRADESLDDQLQDVESEISKTRDKISDITKKVDEIKNEVSNLSGSLSEILATINSLQAEINDLSSQLDTVTKDLNKNTTTLAQQVVLRDRTLRNFYKKSPTTNLLISVIQSNGIFAEDNTSEYLKKYIDDSVELISDINLDISINKENKVLLEELKKEVETEQAKLLVIKKDTEEKLAKQQAELAAKNNDLSSLNQKLSGLLEKQQQILAAKNGDFTASLGEGVQTDDPKSSPNYDPGYSPAFAAFSFGAYTHRNGMSQYGAKGRANDGQDYKEILEFYYKTGVKEKDDFPDEISVEGYGNMDFQKYLYGLGEMPDSWPEDALKAQAIAARSYAYRYVKAGTSICTSQNCQVFIKSKSDNPPSRWKAAVDDTKDKILEDEGVVAYYSSTTGGYINNIGYDADGNWPGDAYEKKAGSPWFYKAWYTKSYPVNSDKCGRDDPWLDEEEMADILNAYIVLRDGGDTSGISPLTTSCWGGDPWSMDKLRDKADNVDKGFKTASSVSDFRFSNDGKTTSFKIKTDQGEYTVSDAQTFKAAFNLRAPGYIAIKSPLFDLRSK